MNDRKRFINALHGKNPERPPLWVMRQAGRYLPEYRALKERFDFLTLVKTPDLAFEVTMQPLLRYELDAAILFSDILVIPEAMGQPYHFREKGGIEMEYSISSPADMNRLQEVEVDEKLIYVKNALDLLRNHLNDSKALLGFCGSPWTLACYMIDGGSAPGFPKTIHLATKHPLVFASLMEKITQILIAYVRMQHQAGIDALQIFDSWHALCPKDKVSEWSLSWIETIIKEVPDDLPIILYAKSANSHFPTLATTGAKALSVDHTHDLVKIREEIPIPMCLQGNLDPELLETNSDKVISATTDFLHRMNGDPAHILNLGHGIRPSAKVECMEALVTTTRNFRLPQ